MSFINRTHCKHGHDWIPKNLYTNPTTGQVVCRECLRDSSRRASPVNKKKLEELKATSKRLDRELHEAIAKHLPSTKIAAMSLACLEARRAVLRFEREGGPMKAKTLTPEQALTKRQKAKVREQNVAKRMSSAINPL